MSYEPQTWVTGDVVTAEKLNHIEAGIASSGGSSNLYIDLTTLGFVPGEVSATTIDNLIALLSSDATNKTVAFESGTYILAKKLVLPSNTHLLGNANTVLTLNASSSSDCIVELPSNNNAIHDVLIEHIRFYGKGKSGYDGVKIKNKVISSSIVNCSADNCNNGFYSTYNGTTFGKSNTFVNCMSHNCHIGLFMDKRAEYTTITGCIFGNNDIGGQNYGGNNIWTNCMFTTNTIGFIISGQSGITENPGHGGCVGCSFNHNGTAAIQNISNVIGWTYSGCNIFYSKVTLDACVGTLFSGCVTGSAQFYTTNCQQDANSMVGCYFQTAKSTALANASALMVEHCIDKADFT